MKRTYVMARSMTKHPACWVSAKIVEAALLDYLIVNTALGAGIGILVASFLRAVAESW